MVFLQVNYLPTLNMSPLTVQVLCVCVSLSLSLFLCVYLYRQLHLFQRAANVEYVEKPPVMLPVVSSVVGVQILSVFKYCLTIGSELVLLCIHV